MSRPHPPVVATRTTSDGVKVYLHADGAVSDRQSYFRVKRPVATMFRAIDDVSLYDAAELPAFIKAWRRR